MKEREEFETNRISVIVPVYKSENVLKRCVDSILSQTYKNLEVILVDDGSPDASEEFAIIMQNMIVGFELFIKEIVGLQLQEIVVLT